MSQVAEKNIKSSGVVDTSVYVTETNSCGLRLKQARESTSKTVNQVAKSLCVSSDYIQALEDDDFTHLPERVYSLGYLKTYAKYLGLNETELLKDFKLALDDAKQSNVLVFPTHKQDKSRSSVFALFVASTLVVCLSLGWFYYQSQTKEDDIPELIQPQQLIDQKIQTLSEIEAIQPVQESNPADALSSTSTVVPEAAPIQPDTLNENEVLAIETISFPTIMDGKTAYLGNTSKYTIGVTDNCWVEVKDSVGNILTTKIFKPSDTIEIANNSSLIISVGNAAAVWVKTDTALFNGLGRSGEVSRGVVIKAETKPV